MYRNVRLSPPVPPPLSILMLAAGDSVLIDAARCPVAVTPLAIEQIIVRVNIEAARKVGLSVAIGWTTNPYPCHGRRRSPS